VRPCHNRTFRSAPVRGRSNAQVVKLVIVRVARGSAGVAAPEDGRAPQLVGLVHKERNIRVGGVAPAIKRVNKQPVGSWTGGRL